MNSLYEQAVALFQRREFQQAEEKLDKLLRKTPDDRLGLNLKGIIASCLKRWDEAEAVFERLQAAHPDYLDAASNLGFLLKQRGRHAEAERHLRRVTELNPRHADAWLNLGVTLKILGRDVEAEACNRKVLEIDPEHVQAHFNLGTLYQDRFDYAAADQAYRQVLQRDPRHPGANNNLVFGGHFLAERSPEARFAEACQLGQAIAADIPRLQRRERPPFPGRALRVGLVSGDLRDHPVGYFLAAVLAASNPERLHFYAYHNHASEDFLSEQLRHHCQAWQGVDHWSDEALAERIDADLIDILIDLSGHSAHNRLPVFARRPAPVQLSWLGYFATTGLPGMDYVLADPYCVPHGEEAWFSERVWRLPNSRFCFSPPRESVTVSPLPVLAGHPFTFGSYQQLPKINDQVLGCWSRILAACPWARLRIQNTRLDEVAARKAFEQRLRFAGIDSGRVSLIGRSSRADYLASHAEVDLLLDTFPYTGGTTTTEALWMGVPTLTLAQPGMLGRQGEALLACVGLDEFICNHEDAYVARAIAWSDPAQYAALAHLRSSLRERLQCSPLMDAAQFVLDLETALRSMLAAAPRL